MPQPTAPPFIPAPGPPGVARCEFTLPCAQEVQSNLAALSITNSGTGSGAALLGMSDDGAGIFGRSTKGEGVLGHSVNSFGVHGKNGTGAEPPTQGAGVWGESATGDGVFGASATSVGVHGKNGSGAAPPDRGAGVWGESDSGYGLYGSSGNLGMAGFFQGDVKVTGTVVAKDVSVSGADCAEDFDVAPTAQIEPGTVVVINAAGALEHSCQAYNKRVAGVISGGGDCRPAIVLDRRASAGAASRVPIALLGKAYCKVDASYAPVEVGDLLTSSPTSGHAMKATEPDKCFGAVIGKALRPLKSGQGMVPILIALQ